MADINVQAVYSADTGRDVKDYVGTRNSRGRTPRAEGAGDLQPSLARALQAVVLAEGAWMADGACAGSSHDGWFSDDDDEDGAPRDAGTRTYATAKRVCATCPVQEPCLEWGVTHDEFGIWGGLGRRSRRALRLQQDGAA